MESGGRVFISDFSLIYISMAILKKNHLFFFFASILTIVKAGTLTISMFSITWNKQALNVD